MKSGSKRKQGSGSKVQDYQMEFRLLAYLKEELQARKKKVSWQEIKIKAQEFSAIIGFKASKGWFNGFKNRFNYEELEIRIIG